MMSDFVKRIVFFLAGAVLIFVLGWFIHQYTADAMGLEMKLSIFNIYLFFFIFSIFAYAGMEGVLKIAPSVLGYSFLAVVFVKIGVFMMAYKDVLLSDTPASKGDKFAMLIPFFLFLLLESGLILKLFMVNDSRQKQN